MSQQSAIEWTDATWNPVRGCTKVSPGCANCYAETFAERWRGVPGHPYEQGFDLRLVPEKLKEPLGWRQPRRVFVNSMSDLFQQDVPFTYIDKVFAVMAFAREHTFQVLTKRADRMLVYVSHIAKSIKPIETAAREMGFTFNFGGYSLLPWPIPNVWLGVSVENQHFADDRIPLLLQTPAAVRFVSAEPLLGDVNLLRYMRAPGPPNPPASQRNYLDWVIVGGESGHGSRLFDVAWARAVIFQCKLAGVACFVKQLGVNVRDRNDAGFEGDTPTSWPMDTETKDIDHSRHWQGDPVRVMLRKKGGNPADWPADLRVREFPKEGSR